MNGCYHEDCQRSTGWPGVCMHPDHIPATGGNVEWPPAVLLESEPIRYRVKGRIDPADRAGKSWDVDLIVEPIA